MIVTLQRYVALELFKTFALATVGLTLTFSLCGGVLNMVQAEVLTAVQMARMMAFVLPIATTLTLPVAALFACANVYGRLAADHEFDACKASGINIHKLLAPAAALSVLTFAFTFTFTNFLIPSLVEQLDAMIRKDLQKLLVQTLNTRGYVKRGPYVLYAGQSETRIGEDQQEVLDVWNAAFLELEDNTLTRCGTAERVRVDFLARASSGDPVVEAVMYNVRALDTQRNQFYELGEQPFDPIVIPSPVEQEPKWLTLPQLLYYSRDPMQLVSMTERLGHLRGMVRDAMFYRYVIEQLTEGHRVLGLEDPASGVRYEMQAQAVDPPRADPDLVEFRPRLEKATITEWNKGAQRHYTADWCSVKVKRGYGTAFDLAHFVLEGNVQLADARDATISAVHRRIDLPDIRVPPGIYAEEARIPDDDLTGKNLGLRENPRPFRLGQRINDARIRMHKEVVKAGLEITAVVHSRLSYSAGVLVMLVLSAALGIICRGGQLLTAFVISFIPGLLVVVLNIMGRQLAGNTGTVLVGIMSMWAGIALVAIADGVVLTRYLRR